MIQKLLLITCVILAFFYVQLNAQSPVEIEFELPVQEGDPTNQLSVCREGQGAVIKFRNSSIDTLRNLRSLLNLTADPLAPVPVGSMEGVYVGNIVGSNGYPDPIVDMDTLRFGTLLPNDSLLFFVPISVICDWLEEGFAQLNLEVVVLHDSVDMGVSPYISESTEINIGEPTFSNPVLMPGTVNVYNGLTDTINTIMSNGGNGAADTVYYCLENSSIVQFNYLTIQSVSSPLTPVVVPISAANSITNGDFTCVVLDSTILTGIFGSPVWPAQNAVRVQEVYEVVSCDENQYIDRRIQYGCNGNVDCDELGQNNFQSSFFNFGNLQPRLAGGLVQRSLPPCYVDNTTDYTFYITNTGQAPAVEVFLSIDPTRGGIQTSSYSIVDQNNVTIESSLDINNTTNCGGGGALLDTIRMLDFQPGDTLFISFSIEHSCNCANCQISNLYNALIYITGYRETCGEVYGPTSSNQNIRINPGALNANLNSLDEGPIYVEDMQSNCYSHTFTTVTMTFLQNQYISNFPDAQLRVELEIPCGLNYEPNSLVFVDGAGENWMPSIDFDSTPQNGGHSVDAMFDIADKPSSFSFSTGMKLLYCLEVDCGEFCLGGPFADCSENYFDFEIQPTLYFSTDVNCSMCQEEDIWCPEPITSTMICRGVDDPSCNSCFTCLGMDMSRVSFGLPDNNNDRIPDGNLDLTSIETTRFMRGDSILASFGGVASNPMNLPWSFGYAIIKFDHLDYLPFNAEVRIWDASDNMYRTCSVVPYYKNVSDSTIYVDFSLDELNNLGCGLSGMTSFDDGDSVFVDVFFRIDQMYMSNVARVIDYETDFYVSETERIDPMHVQIECEQCPGRLTQVGYQKISERDFGDISGCNEPDWVITEQLFVGGRTFDEFPYEVRQVALPKNLTFEIPAAFVYYPSEFEVTLRRSIGNTLLYSGPIPTQFLVINGTTASYDAQSHFESLGLPSIWPDEGYVFEFQPSFAGLCETEQGEYTVSYQYTTATNPVAFMGSEIIDPINEDVPFQYFNGAELMLNSLPFYSTLSTFDTIDVSILNNNPVAFGPNAFLHWSTDDNGASIMQIIDLDADTALVPNIYGMYPLGTFPSGGDLPIDGKMYRLILNLNNCGPVTIRLQTGWDCRRMPTTVEEAYCYTESEIVVQSPISEMNLNIKEPLNRVAVMPCDTIDFEAELLSTQTAYLRNFVLKYETSGGFSEIPGTLEYLYPYDTVSGSWTQIPDSLVVQQSNGVVRIELYRLDSVLQNLGLIGTTDFTFLKSKIGVRFKMLSECDTRPKHAGIRFRAEGYNNCGDRLEPVIKKSANYIISNNTPSFRIDGRIVAPELMPCSNNLLTIPFSGRITSGATNGLTDSISIYLPQGLFYVDGSYNPVVNSASVEPVKVMHSGGQELIWPFLNLNAGDAISFSIDITTIDSVSTLCGPQSIIYETFNSFTAECQTDNSMCVVRNTTSYESFDVEIRKANLEFNDFESTIYLDGSSNAQLNIHAELCNDGSLIEAGEFITIYLYDDSDGSGFVSPSDLIIDTLEIQIDQNVDYGDCFIVDETISILASAYCRIFAVINDEEQCNCSLAVSELADLELTQLFNAEPEVCNGDSVEIGPAATPGVSYEWVGVNGANVALLSRTDTTPVTFSQMNSTSSDLITTYVLRSTLSSCYYYDTVSIRVYPEMSENFEVIACEGTSYALPAPEAGGFNFMWTPSDNLIFPGPDSGFAVIESADSNITYQLIYTDKNGCQAINNYVVMVQNCGNFPATIGDYVWFDLNKDGIQDSVELPVEGVQVYLISALDGSYLSTTFTDENGFYLFDSIPYGHYIVEFEPLDGFQHTIQNVGVIDSIDSDVNSSTGRTRIYTLNTDTIINLTVDAGFVDNCQLNIDYNIGDCYPTDTGSVRNVTLNITWDGNVYTYDQFGYYYDTLSVEVLGNMYTILADTFFGDTTIELIVGNSYSDQTKLNISASFALSDECIFVDTVSAFSACIFDLALMKTATSGPNYSYGDTVNMEILVVNQGIQPVGRVEIIDYFPGGFEFIEGLNEGWLPVGDNYMFVIDTTLNYADTMVIPIFARLRMGPPFDWLNIAEIAAFTDTLDTPQIDIDSEPDTDPSNDAGGVPNTSADDALEGDGSGMPNSPSGSTDEDDADPYLIDIYDLALRKKLVTQGPYQYGDSVVFEITVFNQGSIPAMNISVVDYLPNGLAFIQGSNPDWTILNSSMVVDTITGVLLLPGDSVKTNIVLEIVEADPSEYINVAEIFYCEDGSGLPRFDDIDSSPDLEAGNDAGGSVNSNSDDSINGDGTGLVGDLEGSTDEDDADPAYIAVPLIDIVKTTVDYEPASSGIANNFDVTFDLIAKNIGNNALYNIQLIDNLVADLGGEFVGITVNPFILNDSTTANIVPTLNSTYNGGVYDEIFTGTDGELFPGQRVGVRLVVEIKNNAGPDPIINEAFVMGIDTFTTPTSSMDTALVDLPNCPKVDIIILGDPELYCGDSLRMEILVMPDTTGILGHDGTGVLSPSVGSNGTQFVYYPGSNEDAEVLIWYVADADSVCGIVSDTVAIWVINDTISPEFVNCPEDTIYVGNSYGDCAGFVNWSVPVAYDDCSMDTVQ